MEKYEKILEILKNMDTEELVNIHNEYCMEANYPDDYIYRMEEFDEICGNMEPWEIARTCYYGNFCPAHDYFWFNGYANFESADWTPDRICITDIAAWIAENENALNDPDIEMIFEEDDENSAA